MHVFAVEMASSFSKAHENKTIKMVCARNFTLKQKKTITTTHENKTAPKQKKTNDMLCSTTHEKKTIELDCCKKFDNQPKRRPTCAFFNNS